MHEEKNRPDLREKLSIRKDSKLNQPAIKSLTLKLSACSHENGNNNKNKVYALKVRMSFI